MGVAERRAQGSLHDAWDDGGWFGSTSPSRSGRLRRIGYGLALLVVVPIVLPLLLLHWVWWRLRSEAKEGERSHG